MKKEIVIIYWTDAAMHGLSQRSREETKELGLIDGIVVGHLVHENKERITVAMDHFPKDDEFRCINSYPKSGIKKIKKITLF